MDNAAKRGFTQCAPKLLCLLWLAVVPGIPARAGAGEPRPEAPAVLDRFLGDWETETWIRHDSPPAREVHTKGRATCRKTLAGRYVEFRSWTVPSRAAELQIMTYDASAHRFRQWVFDSDGYRHQADGAWDPATSTLTWAGTINGAAFVIEDHWISTGRLEWTLRRKGADGRSLQMIRGLVTRRKAS
ncbi:MAG: DUF1579 family protein [Candidatus Binatia bacterium]